MRPGLVFDNKLKKTLLAGLAPLLLMGCAAVYAAPLEDPTRPLGFMGKEGESKADQAPVWIVTSILISGERRIAIVNGQAASQGDMVGDAKVVSISATAVTLRDSLGAFSVKLLPTQIKSARDK